MKKSELLEILKANDNFIPHHEDTFYRKRDGLKLTIDNRSLYFMDTKYVLSKFNAQDMLKIINQV